MKVHELQFGEVTTVEVEPLRGKDFGARLPIQAEVVLRFPQTLGRPLLSLGAQSWPVRGVEDAGQHALERLAERDLPRLCWVAAAIPGKGDTRRLLLQVHEFPAWHLWPDAIDVGVDESAVLQVSRKRGGNPSPADAIAWLAEKTLLPMVGEDGAVRLLLSGGTEPGAEQRGAFEVLGQGIIVKIGRGSDERLRVQRIIEARRGERSERRPVLVVQARWRFCDGTDASVFRGVARTQLDHIVERAGSSYLHVWREYNMLERQSILRRARASGWLHYNSRQRLPDGRWRFQLHRVEGLEGKLRALRDLEERELEAGPEVPAELLQDEATNGTASESQGRKRGRHFSATLSGTDSSRGTLDLRPSEELEDVEPPARGVLFSSLEGDRKRLSRREEAWNLIASAECPMPRLGLLIEDQPVAVERRRGEKALSEAARRVFGGPPTPRQVEALRVALETPDIALIQGPPGTGKTRTIAALQVRLAEINGDAEGVSGQTLLTSYQHDAVENAASRTEVFGLPAIKVGRRRGQREDADGFDRWRREGAEHVRADLAQLPDRPLSQVLRQVRNVAAAYVGAPRREDESPRVLRDVEDLARGHLPPALLDRVVDLRVRLERGSSASSAQDADQEILRKAVRALRIEAAAFSDDGPRNAHKARTRLMEAGLLEHEEQALLSRASAWDTEGDPDFLGELAALKERLLDRLLPVEPQAGAPRVHADVEALLSEVVDTLYRRVRESAAGPDAVLATYLDDLENDVEGVREAVRDYTVVLAATCQQSAGHQMSLAKGESILFTNVIVDEAARANPLDLLIPMSRAERRIILVGDHRQLPHILEPDVEQLLERSVKEETGELLRRSLFYRLFESLKARTARDGIQRTVTLDMQYRMHPLLGDFVSETFYVKHGEGFGSGSPAEDFVHGIERYRRDAVAAWVDVPLAMGRERSGQSKSRPVEARWVARQVAELLQQHPDLSFGVITFYSAQVRELMQEMETLGLTEQTEEGDYQVSSAWREVRDRHGGLKERLRVGTVDAFQGKEFDVVFLSVTRSNDVRADDVRSQRRKFGHLLLENRLCVAMSRQQRLLVAVGDLGMLRAPEAAACIPGLVAFRKLCEGSHGVCLQA